MTTVGAVISKPRLLRVMHALLLQGAFPILSTLNLQQNWLNHDLPYEWGYSASFPSLQNLLLSYNAFRLTLPSSWGSNGSFSVLSNLDVSANYLTGELPGTLVLSACVTGRTMSP